MDLNEIISSVAFGIGFLQMYDQVKRQEERIDEIVDKKMLYIALVANLLWVVYQYRKFGMNISTIYTSVSFIVQLYVLKKIIEKDLKD
jgi:hypothetical protein|tara:strand:+ start:579 stop:842 length:264 start_codon:yes stop_codon:yes gene_type:complete